MKSKTFTIILLFATLNSFSQKKLFYCKEEIKLKQSGLYDIQQIDSTILVKLKYSTTDNFVGVDVYGCIIHCFLQKITAVQLSKAQKYLKKIHPELRILIYDGARSRRVQKILWDTLKKPQNLKHLYVANPTKGSIHNYGCAVDLTIANKNGIPLDMGAPFDYFGQLAYPSKEKANLKNGSLTQKHIDNRNLLRIVMMQAGFKPIEYEWWHFNLMTLEEAKAKFKIIE